MMFRKLVLPTALLTAMAVSPVMAENSGDTGGSKAERQQEMQTGKEGYTAGSDMGKESAQSFDELDKNQDGKLDEDELNAWGSTAAGPDSSGEAGSAKAEKMLERYDRDGDRSLSKEEMEQGPSSTKATE